MRRETITRQERMKGDLPKRKYRNEKWLRNQYRNLKKSANEIAEEFGYGSTTIGRWLDKHNIERRDTGEIISHSKKKGKLYYKKDWLIKKYHKEGLTIEEVAQEADVSFSAIQKALVENDIPTREGWEYNKNNGPWDNKEWLQKQYVERKKSAPEIANEFDISSALVYDRLEDFNISRRSDGTKGSGWKNQREYTDEDWLVSEYGKKERDVPEIAQEFSVDNDAIYYWMKKHGIERRDQSERVGEKHPNWKGGRASEYGKNWNRQRNKTRRRDNNTCQACGYKWQTGETKLDVHHIIPIKEFDNPEDANTPDNLITLCRECHNRWEGVPLKPQ